MANTTNYNWETPDDTDLVKDGAAAIRTLGSSVDTTTKALNPSTTLGDIEYRSSTANTNTRLAIGSNGQVLSVVGGVPAWATSDDANAIQNAIVDAKGDLISATAADTPARLAVGANGTVLTADSAEATGLKWAAAAGGGKVLQVVMGTTTTAATNSTNTYADTNLSATITPSSATSKVLVMAMNGSIQKGAGNAANEIAIRLMRGATQIGGVISGLYTNTAVLNKQTSAVYNYLDEPATTSATTYKTQFMNTGNASYVLCQANDEQSVIILMEIGA
jgi:hypothetical protein